MELREKIAYEILESSFGYGDRELRELDKGGCDWLAALDSADAILAMPEYAKIIRESEIIFLDAPLAQPPHPSRFDGAA